MKRPVFCVALHGDITVQTYYGGPGVSLSARNNAVMGRHPVQNLKVCITSGNVMTFF
jgi:hypothetical protein